MRVFLLDLWLDLREKRLAPIAILLLAGIIAVPIVLANGGGSETPPAVPTATTAQAPVAPVIQSQPQAGAVESKLQTFSPRDPFEPTARVATSTGSSSGGGSGGGTSSSGSGSSGTTTTGGSGGGATTGNGPTTTPGTGNGTGTGTGTGNTGNTTGQTKTTLFTYTVDLRFGEGGDVKKYSDVKRLDLVPSEKNPKIVFLGVTTTGKTAVFLVDSNIGVETSGGKCRPSNDNCSFLYLRPDKDHSKAVLTDADGTVYHLRLIAIHRVSISSANGGTTNSGSGNSGSNGNGNTRSHAFTGSADSNSADGNSVPGGDAPPGEPDNSSSNFQQFFADSGQ